MKGRKAKTMKKKLTVLVLAFTMVFTMIALSACGGGSDEGAADSGDKYGEGYEFKQGFDLDYRPYSFVDDNGENGGFDVEMAQAVCEYYGWTYTAVPFNWDAKDAELNAGSCDCIWSGFTINGREDDYLWSKPYSDNTQKIMVKADSGITALADLAGKKVGVQGSTSAQEMLETPNAEGGAEDLMKTFASFDKYDTYTVAVNDLKAGAIDAIAIDVTTGDYQMTKVEGLAYLDEDVCQEVYAIGFRTDDTELRDQVNAALKTLAENGKMDEIGQKYPEIYENLSMINN
jgi:polar amino acid transport system substrate-binding protein